MTRRSAARSARKRRLGDDIYPSAVRKVLSDARKDCGAMFRSVDEASACVEGVNAFERIARRDYEMVFQTKSQINKTASESLNTCRKIAEGLVVFHGLPKSRAPYLAQACANGTKHVHSRLELVFRVTF